MKLETAKLLIEAGVDHPNTIQTWADLGAGNGVFTYALSTLLVDGSTIYAIDRNTTGMNAIKVKQRMILKRLQADFVRDAWNIEPLHGILMANSLHFVKDKTTFLQKLKGKLTGGGKLTIVEYEMEKGNTWVPYPVSFMKLSDVIQEAGFTAIKKLHEIPSVYDNRMMYSALVQ